VIRQIFIIKICNLYRSK